MVATAVVALQAVGAISMKRKSKSAEDYLESILIIREKQGYVRSIDVAKELNVSKPSVSVAMKKLREEKMISMDAEGNIKLLKAGRQIAENVYAKHQLLIKALMRVGVDRETAEAEACQIEHIISDRTYELIDARLNKQKTAKK